MDEKEKLMDEILEKFNANVEEKTKGFLKSEDIEKFKEVFTEDIKKLNEEGLKAFNEEVEKLNKELTTVKELSENIKEIAKNQAIEIDALKSQDIPDVRQKLTKKEQLKALVNLAFNSKEFEKYSKTGFANVTQKMTLDNDENGKIQLVDASSTNVAEKVVIPITSHTGAVMIAEITDVVRDDAPARKMHVRDLLNVSGTSSASIVGGVVTGWTDSITMGATVLAENTAAPESVFTSNEKTWSVKRIANSMRISKRWFKVNGLQWVIDHVLAKLPDATYTVEDFQLLFGDGAGNNVDGLTNDAQTFDLNINTYVATDFASIATFNSGDQTLVTFAAAHGLKNGDTLTIANATAGAAATSYNKAHVGVMVQDATTVLIDADFVADPGVAANWTGSSASIFSLSIDGAQEVDVLSVARALLISGEFNATGHLVNPQQQIQMGLLKATDANYLNIAKDANGEVVGVGGLPLVATTAMPTGRFVTGDFSINGAELKELTPFNIQFIEDGTTAKANEILVVVEEEIIFPVYNPFWFIYDNFVAAKALLETP